jgi:ribosomal protein S18 acetylase RimI-like enzyme
MGTEVYRNKVYGSKLMDKVYEIAKSHGIQKIELDYWADNQMASDFYGKHGFAKYSEFVYKDLI